jgi:hypothetical protein
MATTSTYTFASATSPIAGSNGNPFGSITTALTINSTGIVSATYNDVIATAVGSAITGFSAGYAFEIKFKSSASPEGERRIFTPDNSSTGDVPLSIVRSAAPAGGGVVVHYGTTTTTLNIPAGFFVYDGSMHSYRFEYNGASVQYFRDSAVIGSGSIGAPGTTQNPNRIYVVGSQAGLASDATAAITIESTTFSVGAETPPPPSSTDYISPVSRGIFRGIERGIA